MDASNLTNEEKANLILCECYNYFVGNPRSQTKDDIMEAIIQNIIEGKTNCLDVPRKLRYAANQARKKYSRRLK